MQNTIVNVNGQISSPEDAKVSIFDRGYLYGDSIYEVVRSYNGKFFMLNDHLKRLEGSASLCRIQLSQTLDTYQSEIERTFQAFRQLPNNHQTEGYMRIIVSRGCGKIGFSLSCLTTGTLYSIIIQPVEMPAPQLYNQGVKLKIVKRFRNHPMALDPAMKSGNYLNSLLAYLEAEEEGYYDALFCNQNGHLTEGTTFNLFYVKNGTLITPPLEVGILDGITRKVILNLARELSLPTQEAYFSKEELYQADEVFQTSSVKEVLSVIQIDQQVVGSGTPGPITQKIHKAYQDTIRRITA